MVKQLTMWVIFAVILVGSVACAVASTWVTENVPNAWMGVFLLDVLSVLFGLADLAWLTSRVFPWVTKMWDVYKRLKKDE